MQVMEKGTKQSIVIVKKDTNISSIDCQSFNKSTLVQKKWQWNLTLSHWQCWDDESQVWISDHHPLPAWFLDTGGVIPKTEFLRFWNLSSTWNEMRQHLFWLSISEIQELAVGLEAECLRIGVRTPAMLESGMVNETVVLHEWVSEGLVESIKDAPVDEEGNYDPMRALFQAQSKRRSIESSDSRPHFQTLEQGKFTARH